MRLVILLFLAVGIIACSDSSDDNPISEDLDIQGHRGCRGLMPENTIPGMLKAMEIGVRTLEMDVVITKDNQVLLSHEPFFSEDICQDSIGNKAEGSENNIYQLTYEQSRAYDCGSKFHTRFPDQENFKVAKPLLYDVIEAVKFDSDKYQKALPYFNIEIKSRPEWDGIFHPGVPEYCDLVIGVLEKSGIEKNCIIQSFDVRALQYMKRKHPDFALAYLTENLSSWNKNLKELGFKPDIYSPYFPQLSPNSVKEIQEEGMKVIPWTINEEEDIRVFLEMGIDGIISDYPDRVVNIVSEYNKE